MRILFVQERVLKLSEMGIEGFRSFAERTDVIFDGNVTVVIGANDVGKSNLLRALEHANHGNSFASTDLNFRYRPEEHGEQLPIIRYYYDLDDSDIVEIYSQYDSAVAELPEDERPAAMSPITAIKRRFGRVRKGLSSEINYFITGIEDQLLNDVYVKWCTAKVPIVEVFAPIDSVTDVIDSETLSSHSNDFMEGILHLAGVDTENATHLFTQNDRSDFELTEASNRLNSQLREAWIQGADSDLQFMLRGREGSIELQIQDPAVPGTYTRTAHRSSGFTQFFSVSMMLHARRMRAANNSLVVAFDEPGIWLHPKGQTDLIKVLDDISETQQIVYTTHSLYMLDRNNPIRHRLLTKNSTGTHNDSKPYRDRWGAAVNSLGISVIGSVLFGSKIVLCEGDSDPVIATAILQANRRFHPDSDIDLNDVAFISTGDIRNGNWLIEHLSQLEAVRTIAVLVDGDAGGKERLKRLKPAIERRSVTEIVLANETEIEDYIPAKSDIVPEAVSQMIKGVVGRAHTIDEIRSNVSKTYDSKFGGKDTTKKVGKWAAECGPLLYPKFFEEGISKLGLAREYSRLMSIKYGNKPDSKLPNRAESFLKMIGTKIEWDAGGIQKNVFEKESE